MGVVGPVAVIAGISRDADRKWRIFANPNLFLESGRGEGPRAARLGLPDQADRSMRLVGSGRQRRIAEQAIEFQF